MPKVSVIIPNYNHGAFLEERISSVLAQTFTDFEIIILDDHSTDNSPDIIARYRNNEKITHIVVNEINSGVLTQQWLKGIGLARGEWIWIAESDDVAASGFLKEFNQHQNMHPDMGLFYCDSRLTQRLDGKYELYSQRRNAIFNTQKWAQAYVNSGVRELNEVLKFDCTINNLSAVVFRKSIGESVVKACPDFRYYGDWLLYIGIAAQGGISYSREPLNTCRVHPQSLLNAPTSLETSKLEYFRLLRILRGLPAVTDKKQLVMHFSFNYLSYGLRTDGIGTGMKIMSRYLREDWLLGIGVIARVFFIKIFYGRMSRKFSLQPDHTQFKECRHFVQ